MLGLFLTSLAWSSPEGQCALLERTVHSERQDITVTEMSVLIDDAMGCVTVVELWASWCGPCVKIAPEVEAFHKSHPDVAFISISADATAGAAEKFWKTHPPVGQKYRLSQWSMAELQNTYAQFDATFPEAIPYFIVLDTKGQIQLETHEPRNLNAVKSTVGRLTNQPKEKGK